LNGLLKQGNHLASRVKSNAVAYLPAQPENRPRKRGRPKLYGKKIKLKSLLSDVKSMEELVSPVYGERGVKIRYRACDLLWRPVGQLVRFVAVIHPTRGACLLMSTDSVPGTTFASMAFVSRSSTGSGRRCVKSVIRLPFLDDEHDPVTIPERNQYLHRQPDRYQEKNRRKIHAYHVFMQAGAIAQGLLQRLSVEFPSWFGARSVPGSENGELAIF
jgi:hypothetical protein